jgi:hypothetical protein
MFIDELMVEDGEWTIAILDPPFSIIGPSITV